MSKIYSWEIEKVKDKGKWEARDVYTGRESMDEVKETKYLGDIIQSNGHNNSNIKVRKKKPMEM